MTREEAIHVMEKYTDTESGISKVVAEAHSMAIRALEQEPKTEWTPVSDGLPEKNVEVLATTEWGAVTIAEMYSVNDWFIHEGTTNAETDEIVAWQPLPEPYEEG